MRILVVGNEVGRRDHAPGRMPHPHQRLRSAGHQRAGVDLLLIPQFEPAGLQCLGDIDGGAWRRLGRQQLRDAGAQARRAERRLQRGQHGDVVFLANLPDGFYHNRVRLTDDENLAAEVFPDNGLEDLADIDPVDTHAEHDQVRLLRLQHACQIAGLTAFAGHEAEILESVGKEQSQVLFAVDDAGSRCQFPVPEVRCARMFAKLTCSIARPPDRYPGASGTSALRSQ